jgi:hypothetical protein
MAARNARTGEIISESLPMRPEPINESLGLLVAVEIPKQCSSDRIATITSSIGAMTER